MSSTYDILVTFVAIKVCFSLVREFDVEGILCAAMEWDVIIGCTFDVFVTRTQVELLMDPKTTDILHTHEKP